MGSVWVGFLVVSIKVVDCLAFGKSSNSSSGFLAAKVINEKIAPIVKPMENIPQ